MTSDEAFTRIEAALGPHLKAGGFIRAEIEAHAEAFGSRYAQYENGATVLRLIWDGKECHFVLECDRLPNETKAGPWLDLVLMRFEPRSTAVDSWVSAMGEEFGQALETYLNQWTRK